MPFPFQGLLASPLMRHFKEVMYALFLPGVSELQAVKELNFQIYLMKADFFLNFDLVVLMPLMGKLQTVPLLKGFISGEKPYLWILVSGRSGIRVFFSTLTRKSGAWAQKFFLNDIY